MANIIFGAASINAIRAGRKTVTRRVIKSDVAHRPGDLLPWCYRHPKTALWWDFPTSQAMADYFCRLPIGEPIWVKETWAEMCAVADPICHCTDPKDVAQFHYYEYKADTGDPYPGEWPEDEAKGNPEAPRWKSPIYMPRRACRLSIMVEEITAQRLHDMGDEDILAEGVGHGLPGEMLDDEWRHHWNSINGKKPGCHSDDNPWVWVIKFSLFRDFTERANAIRLRKLGITTMSALAAPERAAAANLARGPG